MGLGVGRVRGALPKKPRVGEAIIYFLVDLLKDGGGDF